MKKRKAETTEKFRKILKVNDIVLWSSFMKLHEGVREGDK